MIQINVHAFLMNLFSRPEMGLPAGLQIVKKRHGRASMQASFAWETIGNPVAVYVRISYSSVEHRPL
mgnify:CR=1 FL=1